MSGVFGQASGSFGSSSSLFGNTANSSCNPFAPNPLGTPAFPGSLTQGSSFGGSSTGVFGSPSSSTSTSTMSGQGAFGSFGSSSSVFGSTSNSSQSPFSPNPFGNTTLPSLSTQRSVFGGTSTGVFGTPSSSQPSNPTLVVGQASSPFGSSSVFGSTGNQSQNPYPHKPAQGSVFGGSSTNAFGGPSSSYPVSTPSFLFGQAPGSFGSSSMLRNTGNPSHSLVGASTAGSSTLSGLPTQRSSFGGTSTGDFGTSSSFLSSPATYRFGVASTTASGSSSVSGLTSSTSNNAFGSAPAFFSQTPRSNFGQTSNGLLGTTVPVNPFATPSSAVATPPFPGTVGRPCGQNRGTKNTSYALTSTKEGEASVKLISISAMAIYGSKSHEELRWEDYELKSGGLQNPGNNHTQEIGSVFKLPSNFSFPSVTSSWSSISPPVTTSMGSTTSGLFSSQLPVFNTPAPSTIMNTSTFQPPGTPSPSTTFGLFSTTGPASSASESVTPISQQGHSVPPVMTLGSLGSWSNLNNHSGIWSTHRAPLKPNAPLTQPPCSSPGFSQFSTNKSFLQPIAQAPLVGTGLNQTLLAPTTATSSIGNSAVVSPGLSLPSLSQQFVSTGQLTDSIVAVRDPFGSQSVTSQPSIDHSVCSSLVQHGISSMPVTNKPPTARITSFLTSRHISLRPLTVHVRKYHPKSNGPKVPFFDHTEEIQNKNKESNILIPRENPRSVFSSSTGPTNVTATKDEASPLDNASAVQYKDEYPNRDNANGRNNEKCINIKPLIPKLQCSDYYTEPNIQELTSTECFEPGFCSHVKDFVVGRHGYGKVKFDGETDVRGLDLDSLVIFSNREVIVYKDEREKPPIGQGLNKAAEVTLLNVKCIDKKTGKPYSSKKMVDKFIDKLKKVGQEQGAEFVSYDLVKGEWKFRVKHFSWYGISDEDWLEEFDV